MGAENKPDQIFSNVGDQGEFTPKGDNRLARLINYNNRAYTSFKDLDDFVFWRSVEPIVVLDNLSVYGMVCVPNNEERIRDLMTNKPPQNTLLASMGVEVNAERAREFFPQILNSFFQDDPYRQQFISEILLFEFADRQPEGLSGYVDFDMDSLVDVPYVRDFMQATVTLSQNAHRGGDHQIGQFKNLEFQAHSFSAIMMFNAILGAKLKVLEDLTRVREKFEIYAKYSDLNVEEMMNHYISFCREGRFDEMKKKFIESGLELGMNNLFSPDTELSWQFLSSLKDFKKIELISPTLASFLTYAHFRFSIGQVSNEGLLKQHVLRFVNSEEYRAYLWAKLFGGHSLKIFTKEAFQKAANSTEWRVKNILLGWDIVDKLLISKRMFVDIDLEKKLSAVLEIKPISIILGEKDNVVDVRKTLAAIESIFGAFGLDMFEVNYLEGAGHSPHVEKSRRG